MTKTILINAEVRTAITLSLFIFHVCSMCASFFLSFYYLDTHEVLITDNLVQFH